MRPEFFSDPIVGKMRPPSRLLYVGLWCLADDAGYLDWDLPAIAAILSPYESVPVRERWVNAGAEALVGAKRVEVYECGHAFIPTLEGHQKIGGNKSFLIRDRHRVHTSPDNPGPVRPVGRYVGREVGKARERANGSPDEQADLIDSFRRRGLPVDVPA